LNVQRCKRKKKKNINEDLWSMFFSDAFIGARPSLSFEGYMEADTISPSALRIQQRKGDERVGSREFHDHGS
jgi:hypothetical protein